MSQINEYIKVGSLAIILLTIGIMYRRWDEKQEMKTQDRNDDAIRDYLLTDKDKLGPINVTRPILWIPIVYEKNSRSWDSFGSRTTYDLNQPYLYLSVKTIIKYCKDSFHICLIDDSSFKRLLPDWKYPMNRISSPLTDHVRKYAIMEILYRYGGMTVPPSFVCMRDLKEMHDNALVGNKTMFAARNINRTTNSFDNKEFYCDTAIMGCEQKSPEMKNLIKVTKETMEKDYTNEMDIVGKINIMCEQMAKYKDTRLSVVDPCLIGVMDEDKKKVHIEELLSNSYIQFCQHTYGILVDSEEILQRPAYSWFARLSIEQVLKAETILSKYLLVANIPGDKKVMESDDTKNPEWIQYWEVPTKAPVWGLKPNYLGNNVLKVRQESQLL